MLFTVVSKHDALGERFSPAAQPLESDSTALTIAAVSQATVRE